MPLGERCPPDDRLSARLARTAIDPNIAWSSPTRPSATIAPSKPTDSSSASPPRGEQTHRVGRLLDLDALAVVDEPAVPRHRRQARAQAGIAERYRVEKRTAEDRDDHGPQLRVAGHVAAAVRRPGELYGPFIRGRCRVAVLTALHPGVKGSDDLEPDVALIVEAARERTPLPAAADPREELRLCRLAIGHLLDDSQDIDPAIARLRELLLGRAHTALARLPVLRPQEQEKGVATTDEIEQGPPRAFGGRGLGLEHHRPHVERLDRLTCTTPDSGHLAASERADEDPLHLREARHQVGR